MNRLAAAATIAGLAAFFSGCASTGTREPAPVINAEPPTYAEIATAHNERASRLPRLWARAAVRMQYTDDDGDRRREQGEGHLQIIAPARLALSVGKVGEVLFWLGSDDHRFWWFDLSENSRASVARHENVLLPCVSEIALPVHPLDLLDLLALREIPATGPAPVLDPEGRAVVDFPTPAGARRVFFDTDTMYPARVELWWRGEASPAIIAELEEYERVDLPSVPGVDPRLASRVTITHVDSDTLMTLFLSDMSDGSRFGRLSPGVFDFEELVGSLDPKTIIVLDEDCATPALDVSSR